MINELPLSAFRSNNSELSATLRAQLQYLWKCSHETAGTSIPLSLAASKQFQSLIDKNCIDLPDYCKERICPWCCAVQIPSITSRVRVRSTGKGSSSNRNLRFVCGIENATDKASVKLKNGVVHVCTVCNKKVPRLKVKMKSKGSQEKDFIGQLEEAKTSKNVSSYLGCRRLQKNKKSKSEPVDMETAQTKKKAKIFNSNSTNSLPCVGSAGTKKFSFMSSVSSSVPSVSIGAVSTMGLAGAVGAQQTNTTSVRPVSLLDLEAAKKKKKKKK